MTENWKLEIENIKKLTVSIDKFKTSGIRYLASNI